MTREQKSQIIEQISKSLGQYPHFYLVDMSGLNAADTTFLRRQCFKQGIKLVVVKNTLLQKAFEASDISYEELYEVLKEPTALMLTNEANAPARLIKDFRKQGKDKPVLKAAYVQESVYVGADQLETLANIKSKEEMIADLILQLQGPMHTVLGQLNSSKDILAGLVKALSEKE